MENTVDLEMPIDSAIISALSPLFDPLASRTFMLYYLGSIASNSSSFHGSNFGLAVRQNSGNISAVFTGMTSQVSAQGMSVRPTSNSC